MPLSLYLSWNGCGMISAGTGNQSQHMASSLAYRRGFMESKHPERTRWPWQSHSVISAVLCWSKPSPNSPESRRGPCTPHLNERMSKISRAIDLKPPHSCIYNVKNHRFFFLRVHAQFLFKLVVSFEHSSL